MNEQILKGKWHQVKGAVKENWGDLTDDDIEVMLGKGEQLAGRLQERYGYSRERAEREVAEFMASFKDEAPMAEVREKSVEVVREHPWSSAGLFFGAIALIVTAYFVSRSFVGEHDQEKVTAR